MAGLTAMMCAVVKWEAAPSDGRDVSLTPSLPLHDCMQDDLEGKDLGECLKDCGKEDRRGLRHHN